MRKAILALLFIFAGVASASAQVGSSQVTATGSFTVAATDVITLKAQIVSCGNGQLPIYMGQPISLTPNQTAAAPFTASNTGSSQTVVFTVPGNDQITCGTQNYSLYAITWYDNGFPLAPTQTYRFVDASSQVLYNLAPISFIPPVLLNAAGALCPANTPVFSGFNANYMIQCGVAGTSSGLPITGGTLQGSLIIPYPYTLTATKINGVVEASQYPGAPDACLQIRNAEVAALAAAGAGNPAFVDATGIQGTQQCGTNMFASFSGYGGNVPVNLTVNLGAVHFMATVGQHIVNSGIRIHGQGRFATQYQYVGTSTIAQGIFYVDGTTGTAAPYNGSGLIGFDMSGMFVYGQSSNAVDAIQFVLVNRSRLEDIATWGVTGSGIHTYGAVTDTFIDFSCSVADAAYIGIQNGIYNTPTDGLTFDHYSTIQTTNGTVIDARAEGVTSAGWYLISANQMHFSAGTSESNASGIYIASGSKANTFTDPDIEANTGNATGVDVADLGQQNYYFNPIFDSPCSGACTAGASFGGGGGQYIFGDAELLSGIAGSVNVIGVNSNFASNSGTTTVRTLAATSGATSAGFAVGSALTVGTTLAVSGTTSTHAVLNATGIQYVTGTACTITGGAIGNNCTTAVTLPVAEADTSYKILGCTLQAGSGPAITGDAFTLTTTGFNLRIIAMSAAATGAGTYQCLIGHN
jgi:hypothetical protein